jgi:hypothetical protein
MNMEYQNLLNLESIINSEVKKNPWQYKVIDDILEIDVFNKIKESVIYLSSLQKDDEFYSDGIWPNEFVNFNLKPEIYNIVTKCASEFLSLKDALLNQFDPYLKSNIGYYNIPKFNYSLNNVESAIHDEGTTKTLALIIYLIPEKTLGTKLYKTKEKNSFFTEIPWKENRGFLMCTEPGKSWHSYVNNGQPRYTLNLYYEKIESLNNLKNNNNIDRTLWFLNNMNENKLISYNE